MTEIIEAECRELAERLGIEWPTPRRIWGAGKYYYYCGGQKDCSPCLKPCNPDFKDTRTVLQLAMEMEMKDYHAFLTSILHLSSDGVSYDVQYEIEQFSKLITDQTGQLAKLLLEWLRGGGQP